MARSAGRVSGVALRAILGAMRGRPARRLLASLARRQLGMEALSDLPEHVRGAFPLDFYPVRAREPREARSEHLGPLPAHDWPRSANTIREAYARGASDPESVLERAIAHARCLSTWSPSRGPLMTYDERARPSARESCDRFAQRAPRSPLEGVPVAIQEAIDIAGLPSRHGSAWRGSTPAAHDSAVIARLRQAGAVILGQTPMTEHGLNPFGINPHRSMPRNAHDSGRLAGGSATGSGVAVAAGITPVSVGMGGGGSIRIPASLNGVFALKPTFGRIPSTGCGTRSGSTLATPGPLGVSTYDLAVFLEVAAGPDPLDPGSQRQPPPAPGVFRAALERGVVGLRVGIDEQEWIAAASATALCARKALGALERAGAELVPIRLPMASHAAAIGYLTLGTEAIAGLREARADYKALLGPDTQLLVAALEQSGADEYLDAQRLRGTLRQEVRAALSQVDVIALPTTVHAAPPLREVDAAQGFVDTMALDALCRFAFLADLTGLPAATAPVGIDEEGMPVGLQVIGDAWDEATVLQVVAHLERLEVARVLQPEIAVDLLSESRRSSNQ